MKLCQMELNLEKEVLQLKKMPVPVSAILSTIGEILVKGTGEDFDLEIYERPRYDNPTKKHVTITLNFNIREEEEEEAAKPNKTGKK